jgi:hypothetical protein
MEKWMMNKMDELLNEHWQQKKICKKLNKRIGWNNFMLVYLEKYNI